MSLKQTTQPEPSKFEKQAAQRAHHRALIMQILKAYPDGLTTMQIMNYEQEFFGFRFLTDNRLRELRSLRWVESFEGEDGLLRWRKKAEA